MWVHCSPPTGPWWLTHSHTSQTLSSNWTPTEECHDQIFRRSRHGPGYTVYHCSMPPMCLSSYSPQISSWAIQWGSPDALGVTFATDVIRRARQMILILRECVTSYSVACFVANESHDALHVAIVSLCISLVPLDGPRAVIRADPASWFVALLNDPEPTSVEDSH